MWLEVHVMKLRTLTFGGIPQNGFQQRTGLRKSEDVPSDFSQIFLSLLHVMGSDLSKR